MLRLIGYPAADRAISTGDPWPTVRADSDGHGRAGHLTERRDPHFMHAAAPVVDTPPFAVAGERLLPDRPHRQVKTGAQSDIGGEDVRYWHLRELVLPGTGGDKPADVSGGPH